MGAFIEGKLDEKNRDMKFMLWTLLLTREHLREPGFPAGTVAVRAGPEEGQVQIRLRHGH